ncbi:MAG: phosphoribosylformylglycinamidine cyclo-ligase [Vampirovibrionales bacterium]|nr:phosphoribosylformylglycinamidine cyclo-ligase [Vampirovibrionales bacterium]
MTPSPLTTSDEAYRQAGVDLKRADAVVDIAKAAAKNTGQPFVLGGIGGFSGAFEIPDGYQSPVLLTACDGVGTKLKLAFLANRHDSVGIDLVAMSVNDILVNGGRPLAFLDYVATAKIEPNALAQILGGIGEGCAQSGCALLGGETAEMPGFYAASEYDLAGFCVGVAEKKNLYPKRDQIAPGQVLIGLSSSGLHSNGYSLVRKILLEDHALDLSQTPEGLNESLGDALLRPTTIYVEPVLALLEQMPEAVLAMVHVTGGGFYDNIPRVLPDGVMAKINRHAWQAPKIFGLLQRLGKLSDETMAHTFNCGIGFILLVKAEEAPSVLDFFSNYPAALPYQAIKIGQLEKRHDAQSPQVIIDF